MSEKPRRQPGDGTETVRTLLDRAREAGMAAGVPNDIVGSWRRSVRAGLRPETLDVPYRGDIDDRGRLAWAAGPVLRRIVDDLTGSEIGLLLTDTQGLVIDRLAADHTTVHLLDGIHLAPGFEYREDRIGTNAIGTALQRMAPTVVQGHEHFATALTGMACAAATVIDPRTGRVLGVVDLSCPVRGANALMLPLAKRAAWEIEQRLLDEGDSSERLLRLRFRDTTRTARGPLIGISGQSLLANGAATKLVEGADHLGWWEQVEESLAGHVGTCVLTLPGGSATTWKCQPIHNGAEMVGAILFVVSPDGQARRSSGRDFGWDSLTDSELAVATQVSAGMTNREVAARLYVSPHTIDFHLRALFRKLDVRSRVELTRVVLEHQLLPGSES